MYTALDLFFYAAIESNLRFFVNTGCKGLNKI